MYIRTQTHVYTYIHAESIPHMYSKTHTQTHAHTYTQKTTRTVWEHTWAVFIRIYMHTMVGMLKQCIPPCMHVHTHTQGRSKQALDTEYKSIWGRWTSRHWYTFTCTAVITAVFPCVYAYTEHSQCMPYIQEQPQQIRSLTFIMHTTKRILMWSSSYAENIPHMWGYGTIFLWESLR